MDYANKFLEFLKSNEKSFHIEDNKKHYDIFKIQHSEYIDLLFMNSNNYHKTSIDDRFEYCGLYDKVNDKLYNIGYTLRMDILKLDYNDTTYKGMNDLLKEFNQEVQRAVEDYVYDNPKEFYDAAGDYESNQQERYVTDHIINNEKEVKYKCNYNSDNKDNILSYIEQGQDYIYEVALGVIERDREYIGKRLIDIDKTNELLKEIYNNPNHYIHKRKDIVDVMKDGNYGNVHVYINKDGKYFDFKYDANELRHQWDSSYLSTYSMQAPDRRDFEKLFKKYTDLYYDEIYKIEYRGKVIYEDKDFKFEEEQTVEETLDADLVL